MKLITIIIIVAIVNLLQSILNKPKRNRVNKRQLHKKSNGQTKNTNDIGEYTEIEEMMKPYVDYVDENIIEDEIDKVKVEEPEKTEFQLSNTHRKKHKSTLNIKKKNIEQGIIWNEILSKPKSLRK